MVVVVRGSEDDRTGGDDVYDDPKNEGCMYVCGQSVGRSLGVGTGKGKEREEAKRVG
jgi:hypothetical protein